MESTKPTLGWLGTGVMGKSMCGHLLKAGYAVNIFTRTREKAEELLKNGATWMEPLEMAKTCDIVIMMLGYPKDVQEMALGEAGLLKHMKKG